MRKITSILNKVAVLMATTAIMATAVYAKTFKIAYDADPVTLDIQEQLSGGMLQHSHLVFDPLVRWTKDLQIEPRLATRWEQPTPTTMIVTLRKGGKIPFWQRFYRKRCYLYH